MDVDDAARVMVYEEGAENAHKPAEADQLGFLAVNDGRQLPVEKLAGSIFFVVYHEPGEAVLLSPGRRRRRGRWR